MTRLVATDALGIQTTSAGINGVVDNNPPVVSLTARATDNQGLSAVSAARTVTLEAANTAPTVSLTAPANNSTYVLPADLIVSANASDLEKNGGVTQVEFLANGQIAKPYSLVWSNPTPGSYTLIARATPLARRPTRPRVPLPSPTAMPRPRSAERMFPNAVR